MCGCFILSKQANDFYLFTLTITHVIEMSAGTKQPSNSLCGSVQRKHASTFKGVYENTVCMIRISFKGAMCKRFDLVLRMQNTDVLSWEAGQSHHTKHQYLQSEIMFINQIL